MGKTEAQGYRDSPKASYFGTESSLTRSYVSALEYSLGNSPPKLGSSYCWESLIALPVLSLPGMQGVRGPASQPGVGPLQVHSPLLFIHGWVRTFFKFYLKDIWAVGCFGRVLSLCVETRRCLILKRDRGRKLRHREPHQAYTPARHLLQVPPCPCPGPLVPCTPPPVQWVQGTTSSLPAPPAGGLRNKGLKKSDNFSPQLDLIFFFDAPTAGGRIAGEKQVRQERVGLHRTAVHRLPGSCTHTRVTAWNWDLFCTDRKANDCA